MARVYVSIGSNIDRETNVASCLVALRGAFGAIDCSPVYECPAVGFSGDDFYNLVVGFDTELAVREVATRLREIEFAHGRRRDLPKFSARTLDLDLLLYDALVQHGDGIDVPRDEITRYAFVLRPLADLAGERCHPELGLSFAELWARFAVPDAGLRRVEPSAPA